MGAVMPATNNSYSDPAAVKEDVFLKHVLTAAMFNHWRTLHIRPARTKKGWRTAVQGDGAGFPDLLLLRGRRLIVAELKREKESPTESQAEWLDGFRATGVVEVYVWRPSDWPDIEECLQ